MEGGFASPYATGGGGVVLEHAYGAVLLADLLLGHPVLGLGDEITPREVRFQQAVTCPVDDLVVLGDCPTGTRTIYIGVRRAPVIGASSSKFVDLLVNYLRMVVDRRSELDTDQERLGLAVSAPHTGASEVAQLAFMARRQPDDDAFRALVAAPLATKAKVRTRLSHLDAAVAAAVARGDGRLGEASDGSPLTWRLLKALQVIELRLEGDHPADATNMVGRLVPLAGDAARAAALWRRLLELAAKYAQAAAVVTVDMITRDVSAVVQVAAPTATATASPIGVRDEQVYDRLRQLPAPCGPRLLAAWRDDQVLSWRLITAMTTVDDHPTRVLRQWMDRLPGWLATAPWQVQLAAGELADAYGVGELAAHLFVAAADQGAPRRDFWLARAVLINDENRDDAARQAALAALRPGLDASEQFVAAVVALLTGDRDAASRLLHDWVPDEPSERTLGARLRLRLAGPSDPNAVLDRDTLDRGLQVLAGALREQWAAGLAVARAQLLIVRARRGESSNWDVDLREAVSLAVRARDARRTYRGDSAEAVAVACHASMILLDTRGVLLFGSPTGEATVAEAASAEVCEFVAMAAVQRGELALARDRAAYVVNEAAKARIDASLAEADGRDPRPLWWRAAELAGDSDEQLAQALAGLAGTGVDGLVRFPDFAQRYPDAAAEFRAMAEISAGRPGAAITRLREHRRSSVTAAFSLALAYQAAGRTDDQVQTLRDAADHFNNASLRHAAAEALARAERLDEADDELRTLFAGAAPGWSGRADALRLAARLAGSRGWLDQVCDRLRSLLQIEPEDAASRWTLIRTLLSRGDLNEAWRALHEAPEPLDPSNPAEALAWVKMHRRRGQPVETVMGCLRLLGRFGDDEQFSAGVLTNLMLPWPAPVELPGHVRAQLATETERFFQRWPASPYLHRIQVTDPEQLRADMVDWVRGSPENELQWRRLLYRLARGEVPLGTVAAMAGRTYAEICLHRAAGVLPAHRPDPDEYRACREAVQAAEDRDLVIDTPAIIVLLTLPDPVRQIVTSRFARVVTSDDVMVDALNAKDTLALRSTASWHYDEQQDHLLLTETDEAEADRLALEASRLHDAVEALIRVTPRAAAAFYDLQSPALAAWISPLELARSGGSTLLSDDPWLRALARGNNVPATSSQAVLQHLASVGVITDDQLETCIRTLIKARIGDMPLNEQRLLELAEDANWNPGSVAAALARPATWADPPRTLAFYRLLVAQVRSHARPALSLWLHAAVRGATTLLPRPNPAARLAAAVLVTTIDVSAARGNDVEKLVTATRQALAGTDDPDQETAADPLPIATILLRDSYAKTVPRDLAVSFTIATFSALGQIDRDIVARSLLQ